MEIKLIKDDSIDKFVEQKMDFESCKKNDYINSHACPEGYVIRDIYNYAVYDGDKIIAATLGWMRFEWFFLRDIWVDEEYRNQGIGSMLLNKIEEVAKSKNQIGIRLATWEFQAPKFYEKHGYELCGKIEDSLPGVTEYMYIKKLNKGGE